MPLSPQQKEEIREKLAAIEHQRWAEWQKYMHSKLTKNIEDEGFFRLDSFSVERWERQINTPYDKLTEREKSMDMEQVDRYWPIIEEETSKAYSQGREDGIAKGEVSERKFILTILDGHDQAHKEAGISSHTRTIRMLLSHRHVGKLPDNKPESL